MDDEDERGSLELRAVAEKIKACTGPEADLYHIDSKKESYTIAQVTYETRTEKKVGRYIMSRKRGRRSITVSDHGKIGDVVGIKRRF